MQDLVSGSVGDYWGVGHTEVSPEVSTLEEVDGMTLLEYPAETYLAVIPRHRAIFKPFVRAWAERFSVAAAREVSGNLLACSGPFFGAVEGTHAATIYSARGFIPGIGNVSDIINDGRVYIVGSPMSNSTASPEMFSQTRREMVIFKLERGNLPSLTI